MVGGWVVSDLDEGGRIFRFNAETSRFLVGTSFQPCVEGDGPAGVRVQASGLVELSQSPPLARRAEVHRKIAVTSALASCFTRVPAIPLSCFPISAALPFVANGLRLVAKTFSGEPAAVFLQHVRSCQLYCVAGSLWGRPHFFAHALETAACHDGKDLLRCTVRSHR